MAAKCILPVTQSDVPKSYGTRHRAAIGMSEISDAIIIVVSEETGGISIAQGGELRRNIDPVRLQQTLQRYLTINTRKRSKKRWPSKAGAGEKQQGLKTAAKPAEDIQTRSDYPANIRQATTKPGCGDQITVGNRITVGR